MHSFPYLNIENSKNWLFHFKTYIVNCMWRVCKLMINYFNTEPNVFLWIGNSINMKIKKSWKEKRSSGFHLSRLLIRLG